MHTLKEHNKDINKPPQQDMVRKIRHHGLHLSISFSRNPIKSYSSYLRIIIIYYILLYYI